VVVACVTAAVAAIALVHDGRGARAAQPTGAFAGGVRPVGPPTAFALRDEHGRLATAAQLRGRVAIVAFVYSTCRDTCPLLADQVRAALDRLGAAGPAAVAISVDPAGDTAQSARRFLRAHDLSGRMRFLLGTRERLQPVWRAFGIRPQGARAHSAWVVLLDREGRQRIGFPADQLTPEDLAHDARLLAGAGGPG